MHHSFVSHRNFHYFKIALGLALLSIALYVGDSPSEPPNGGTWLGYTLGSLGAVIIVLLLWLGIRKRSFQSRLGTLAGWTSSHIYLGTALIVIGTLHAGFQFGWNVHTLAYALMILVIISGFYGVYTYYAVPTLVTENRQQRSKRQMIQEIAELDARCLEIAEGVGEDIHEIVLKSVEATQVGGSLRHQLTLRDNDTAKRVLGEIQNRLTQSIYPAQSQRLHDLLEALREKFVLVDRIEHDIRYRGLMRIWLYFHVPLSVALLGALIAHIFSVFFYW